MPAKRTTKPRKLSKRDHRAALLSCVDDPRQGPFAIVAETATSEYLIQDSLIRLRTDQSYGTIEQVVRNLGLVLARRPH